VSDGQIRIVSRDDLERGRWSVFFRFFLAIPHLLVVGAWGLAVLFMAVINWFAILFTRRPVPGNMTVHYLRYLTQVDAYLNLAAQPFPGFGGGGSPYTVDLEFPVPQEQNRWKTAFRLVLAIPAVLLGTAFGAAGVQAGGGSARVSLGLIAGAAFLGWFASLVRGRMPDGLRDLIIYGVGYSVQVAAYLLLLTDRYPNSDPLDPDYGAPARTDHPVLITSSDDLRRSRLTVFFRLLLWLPHLVWLILWGIVTMFAVVANWFATLFAGRPAEGLHRFIARYLRYWTHTNAFLYLVSNPFPAFGGREGSYPVDLEIAPPARQNRWKTGFRVVLVVPALIIGGALANVLSLVAVFGWFTGVFLGRMPPGLRNLGVFALRYQAQVAAYFWLLTDQYPHSGPTLELRGKAAAAPQAA
jgi:hypothetical protein